MLKPELGPQEQVRAALRGTGGKRTEGGVSGQGESECGVDQAQEGTELVKEASVFLLPSISP